MTCVAREQEGEKERKERERERGRIERMKAQVYCCV